MDFAFVIPFRGTQTGDMANFYGQWLEFWRKSPQKKRRARVVNHEEELEWMHTPQDVPAAHESKKPR